MCRLVGVFVGWAGGESESQCNLLRKSIFPLFFLFYSLKQGDSWSAESGKREALPLDFLTALGQFCTCLDQCLLTDGT